MEILVREGTIDEVISVYPFVPELENPYQKGDYERRLLASLQHLIVVALVNAQVVGFKVGYQRDNDGSFYSWMGGVSNQYRRLGIAQKLADAMEIWCVSKGYRTLRFKTRNRHKAMLAFGLSNGFNLIAIEPAEQVEESRIWLEKRLY